MSPGEPSLAPKELAHRLWTSYQLLDKPELQAGTYLTSSTTVYDGKGNLITAALADAAAFGNFINWNFTWIINCKHSIQSNRKTTF